MKYAKLTEIFSKGRAMSENKSDYKAKEAEKFSLKTLEAEFMDENEEGLLKLSQKQKKKDGDKPEKSGSRAADSRAATVRSTVFHNSETADFPRSLP